MLKLYNTLTRVKEEFIPITPKKVRFYHCGPTVYWTQHIGNLRGMMMGDLLVRTLRFFGNDVDHVRNYTDVGHLTSDSDTGEDKMEKGVKREGISATAIADKYIAQFERDCTLLHLSPPTHAPRATVYVPQMIAFVSELIAKGFAYTTPLAVYFDVAKFPAYTSLSHQKMDQLQDGAGKGDVEDAGKKSPVDFALWFFRAGTHANALQYWPSPFVSPLVSDGAGFPGWHIECSAMSRALLGVTIDIHFGGVEHIPVHHTNEIAQSESANGVPFVHYWMHNEHLLVNDRKMAKSEGTGFSLQEIIDAGYDPIDLRYFFLQAAYRSKQNFTWEGLKAAQTALREMKNTIQQYKTNGAHEDVHTFVDSLYYQKFVSAIENDLNIPQALGVAWELIKSDVKIAEKLSLLLTFDQVFGLGLDAVTIEKEEPIPHDVQLLVEARERHRKDKNFAASDALRKQIEDLGYELLDTSTGCELKIKN